MRNMKICFGRVAPVFSAVLVAAIAGAQPYRIAWTRSSASTDVIQDTANDAAVLPNGQYVVVGSSKQTDGTYKGCATIFNRNRAVVKVAEFSHPGGGSLCLTKVICANNKLYLVGQGTSSNDPWNPKDVYVASTNFALEIDGESAGYLNAFMGLERVTDAAVDPDGNLLLAAIAQKAVGFETCVVNAHTSPFDLSVFGRTNVSNYCEPEMTTKGIIAILIGLLKDNGPTVQSYSPAGALNWSFGISNPGSSTTNAIILQDVLISSYMYAGTSWTEEPTPGNFVSHGRVHKIDTTTGAEVQFGDTPGLNGADMVQARDCASGQATGKRVNMLFRYGNHGRIFSYDHDLALTGDWTSPMTCLSVTDLVIDPFNSLYASLVNNENIQGKQSFGAALNSSNETRFSWGMSQTGYLLPYMEQSNVIENESGDILTLRTDNTKMQLVKVEQAPVGASDAYQPKSGKFFRPVLPVTSNDRYAGGAAITIVQQPAHGALSMGANGIFNYTSAMGFVGLDSFKYRLTKAGLNTSTVTVNLNVKP